MALESKQKEKNGAELVVWDLSDLYTSDDENGLGYDLAMIESKAMLFRETWNGRLGTTSIQDFLEMVHQYEHLVETMDRMGSYTQLKWSTDSENVVYARLLQRVRETIARAYSDLVFVSIQLTALPQERLVELLDAPELASRQHWLERVMEFKPYALSEEVERALGSKSITSRTSWVRLYDEISNAQVYSFNGEELTMDAIAKLSFSQNRQTRKDALAAFAVGLEAKAKMHAYIFNTLIADCESNDRLRGFPSWVSSRNLENEVSDESVQSLIDAVVGRYDLVRRFYALKKNILGLDTFHDYDRNAQIGSDNKLWTWEEARTLVLEAYRSFDPRAGEIATMFFEKNWIHAPVQKGKRSGAYSAGTIASAHPYIFVNFSGTSRDVQTLAHELGHGIHQYLSRQQGPILMDTPLTIAETASVFGEMLTFKKLYETTESDAEKLSLIMSKLDGMIGTVFRQVALNRFEDAVHNTRRQDGEQSLDQISEIWMRTQKEQFGDSVILSEKYVHFWTYISHFIHAPGYVYAYAFGELLVLALYEIYKVDPKEFTVKYVTLLSSGGSKRPKDLLAPFGIDITDASFWNTGLAGIERFIDEAELLSKVVPSVQA